MPRLFPVLALALLAPLAAAQPVQERHSEVRLSLPEAAPNARPAAVLAQRLATHDLHLDHAHLESTPDGPALRTVLSESEIVQALASGVDVDVLIEDMAAHYLANRQGTCQEGRAAVSRISADLCGTMGGYPTWTDIIAKLDDLQAAFPSIVSTRSTLGQTIEGRDIWMVEITDNPGVDEGEPEALFTALHHAREPGSMMAIFYFMHYLAEQYGIDPDVTDLVDNRRLFFVPVLNADGYVYNETTNPDGGGFWRKNRRENGDGSFGVDPNRNYGYNWGLNDNGSSPNPGSGTYRGTEPFSEPLTSAMRDFLEDGRNVRVAMNYHTSGDLLLYPWGYEYDTFTPDEPLLHAMGDSMTYLNGYTYGQSANTIYRTNGDANDWMYGEQETKPKILSFTPEVGYAFWPDPFDVYPLADENLEMNMLVALFADSEARPPVTVANETQQPLPSGAGFALVGPNPIRDRTAFQVTLSEAQSVRVSAYDVLGREVAVLADGPFAPGRQTVLFDTHSLAPGTYIVQLSSPDGVQAQRVTVVR